MARRFGKRLVRPTQEQIDEEIQRMRYWHRYKRSLRSAVYSLLVAAAAAVLVSTLWMPVLRITGTSMAPTLGDGELVTAVKTGKFQQGDVIAFYYNNKILVKRVIATAGQWVDIDDMGNVSVDNVALEEPYIMEKSLGECNIELPFQVPDGRVFVMGDDRAISLDSRTTTVGTVSHEQVLGRILYRVWPLREMGKLQ